MTKLQNLLIIWGKRWKISVYAMALFIYTCGSAQPIISKIWVDSGHRPMFMPSYNSNQSLASSVFDFWVISIHSLNSPPHFIRPFLFFLSLWVWNDHHHYLELAPSSSSSSDSLTLRVNSLHDVVPSPLLNYYFLQCSNGNSSNLQNAPTPQEI